MHNTGVLGPTLRLYGNTFKYLAVGILETLRGLTNGMHNTGVLGPTLRFYGTVTRLGPSISW